jgi:hypothetical protein
MAMTKIGRNDLCPCGSGKKYKHCCLAKDQGKRVDSRTSPLPLERPRPEQPMRAVPTPLPAPRITTEEDLRWEAFWERFTAADLDGRVAIAIETIQSEPNDGGELAFELVDALHGPLVAAGQFDRLDALLAPVERIYGGTESSNAGYFALWRAEAEVVAARGRELEAMRRLGAHVVDVLDLVHRLIDRLRFHGRADLLEALVAAAWPHVSGSDKITVWGKDDLAGTLVRLIINRHRVANPELRPDDAALLEELTPIFAGRDDAMHAALALVGHTPRHWALKDFAKARDEADTSLFDLTRDFATALESRWGVHPLRAELIRESIEGMLRHEVDPPAAQSKAGKAHGRPRETQTLAVVPRSVDAFFRAHANFLSVRAHAAAAAFLALPKWGEFLADNALTDRARASESWRLFVAAAQPHLLNVIISHLDEFHDPVASSEIRPFVLE